MSKPPCCVCVTCGVDIGGEGCAIYCTYCLHGCPAASPAECCQTGGLTVRAPTPPTPRGPGHSRERTARKDAGVPERVLAMASNGG